MNNKNRLHMCIVGSSDFVRRMTSAARQIEISGSSEQVLISSGNIIEAKQIALSQRPQVLLLDVGFKTSRSDVFWTRNLLCELRERFRKNLYIILAATTPEKFVLAGTLLFESETTLAPSGLIDNLIIAPPPGTPKTMSMESQLKDCIAYVAELLEQNPEGTNPLPALWEQNWVPSMCDPQSRLTWMRWLPRYARYTNENPLIIGPTGSGKTRLASAIHTLSDRKGLFVSITPRDFSSTELIQAELFGAVQGAYTGAVDKWGLVKKADKGTLFIDELQSIDIDLQGKLITFIENKTYRRVGEAESNRADVRFVFASNRSLQCLVDEGRLRDDFAYRLERLQLTLKPLDERRLDISAGICFALAKVLRERAQAEENHAIQQGVSAPALEGLSAEAYRLLFGAAWPGNLRQLENTIAKLIELSSIRNLHLIDQDCVQEALQGLLGMKELTSADMLGRAAQTAIEETLAAGSGSLDQFVRNIEEHVRKDALERSGGDPARAAQLVGDSPQAMELFAAARSSS